METLFSADSPIWTCGELNSPTSEEIFSSTSNMTGFTLSPLELEPLPSIFTPNNNYKWENLSETNHYSLVIHLRLFALSLLSIFP